MNAAHYCDVMETISPRTHVFLTHPCGAESGLAGVWSSTVVDPWRRQMLLSLPASWLGWNWTDQQIPWDWSPRPWWQWHRS